MSANLARYARDTQDRSPHILREISLASRESTLYPKLLASASSPQVYERKPKPVVRVVPTDTLTAAVNIDSTLEGSMGVYGTHTFRLVQCLQAGLNEGLES